MAEKVSKDDFWPLLPPFNTQNTKKTHFFGQGGPKSRYFAENHGQNVKNTCFWVPQNPEFGTFPL